MSITIPDYLQPGDTVDIVAPSSKCHPSVIEKIKELLSSWQLSYHVPDDLFGESLLYANSDEKRFYHLERALTNPTSKAVWCLLGGYGATSLLPMLNKIKPPAKSKFFIGFSDITALHIFLQDQWGWCTIHGPSGYQAALDKVSGDSVSLLKKLLFGAENSIIYNEILPLNKSAEVNAVINAPLIGGNLHLIQNSLGTFWQIKSQDKILFIEEINERAYRIDRILTHLSQAGIFDKAKAILFGDMLDKGEPDGKFLVDAVMQEFAQQYALPVLQIKNVGHGSINNPILLGSQATLYLERQPKLVFNLK